jgi:hypothetical protein
MDRQNILDLMRATAAENGGQPLGRLRFEAAAGIKEYHWSKHWPRYNDLVLESGLEPNKKQEAYSTSELIESLALLTRRLGRFPTNNDLRGTNSEISDKTFRTRFVSKVGMVQVVREFCQCTPGWDDVLELCPAASVSAEPTEVPSLSTQVDGYVYLMKSGRYFKIGKTNHVGRREYELAIQMPDKLKLIHTIMTDDPDGIEQYWHRRFVDKRKNGEWFDLTATDVTAFRRRKFM